VKRKKTVVAEAIVAISHTTCRLQPRYHVKPTNQSKQLTMFV